MDTNIVHPALTSPMGSDAADKAWIENDGKIILDVPAHLAPYSFVPTFTFRRSFDRVAVLSKRFGKIIYKGVKHMFQVDMSQPVPTVTADAPIFTVVAPIVTEDAPRVKRICITPPCFRPSIEPAFLQNGVKNAGFWDLISAKVHTRNALYTDFVLPRTDAALPRRQKRARDAFEHTFSSDVVTANLLATKDTPFSAAVTDDMLVSLQVMASESTTIMSVSSVVEALSQAFEPATPKPHRAILSDITRLSPIQERSEPGTPVGPIGSGRVRRGHRRWSPLSRPEKPAKRSQSPNGEVAPTRVFCIPSDFDDTTQDATPSQLPHEEVAVASTESEISGFSMVSREVGETKPSQSADEGVAPATTVDLRDFFARYEEIDKRLLTKYGPVAVAFGFGPNSSGEESDLTHCATDYDGALMHLAVPSEYESALTHPATPEPESPLTSLASPVSEATATLAPEEITRLPSMSPFVPSCAGTPNVIAIPASSSCALELVPSEPKETLDEAQPAQSANLAEDQEAADRAYLGNFVSLHKASKAARSVAHESARPSIATSTGSPNPRTPLGHIDSNTVSPSPMKEGSKRKMGDGDESHASMPPSKRGQKGPAKTNTNEDAPLRRSSRVKAKEREPVAGSKIPVRVGSKVFGGAAAGGETKELDLVAVTRANTRRNKGKAIPPAEVLARQEVDLAARRMQELKEVHDARAARIGRRDAVKRVQWGETSTVLYDAEDEAEPPKGKEVPQKKGGRPRRKKADDEKAPKGRKDPIKKGGRGRKEKAALEKGKKAAPTKRVTRSATRLMTLV